MMHAFILKLLINLIIILFIEHNILPWIIILTLFFHMNFGYESIMLGLGFMIYTGCEFRLLICYARIRIYNWCWISTNYFSEVISGINYISIRCFEISGKLFEMGFRCSYFLFIYRLSVLALRMPWWWFRIWFMNSRLFWRAGPRHWICTFSWEIGEALLIFEFSYGF
jgi:hypothetical protein